MNVSSYAKGADGAEENDQQSSEEAEAVMDPIASVEDNATPAVQVNRFRSGAIIDRPHFLEPA